MKIALVEVDFSNPNTNYEEMHLLTEPLFSVPIDEAYIVTNTYDQRSNFHGSDTWLHVRMFCSGFSLDSWSEKKIIQVYDLETDVQAMTRVTAIGFNTIV